MSGRSECILIAGDDADGAAALAGTLEPEGFVALRARSAEEAVAALREGRVDLVLADLDAPGADGPAFVRRLQAERPALPVLVLAAQGSIEAAVEAVREGAVDFVRKPVLAVELLHRVDGALRERSRHPATREPDAGLPVREPEVEANGPAATAAPPGPDGDGEGDLVRRLMNSQIAYEQFERELLVRALRRTRGNQSRAARMLGLTRRTLQYRIDKFDIDTGAMKGET